MEEKTIRCSVCRIDSEKAKEKGIEVKKLEMVETMNVEGGVINIAALNNENIYLCTECKEEFKNTVMGSGIKKVKQKMSSFESFIKSSAFLMNLDNQIIAETCLKIFSKELVNLASSNLDLAIVIGDSTVKYLNNIVEELEREKIRRDEQEQIRRKLEVN